MTVASSPAVEGVEAIVGDRYRITCELGRGGMGVVYLAHDVRRDMDVAIKLCWRKHADALLWLKREFRAVASLRHDNLVELFELVANEHGCYFTMEYLLGQDPREWVGSRRPRVVADEISQSTLAPLRAADSVGAPLPPVVDWKRLQDTLAQLAEAIGFLHARGVIHRDVKPSNVLVVDGTVKLLDFGIALDRRRVDGAVPRERRMYGTSAYLAPEYIGDRTISTAMDMYAFGVLAFELATGALPSGDRGRDRQPHALPLASRLNPEVPRPLEDLIDRLLSSNPMRRPTAAAVASELAAAQRPRSPRHVRCFVGREDETARLGALLASRAPRARVAVIAGPSGIGKSSLVDDALSRARANGTLPALVWRGRCHDRELLPFRAFDFVIDDLASYLATDDDDDDDRPVIGDVVRHAAALARVFPALAARLDIPDDREPIDPRTQRERALLAMARLLEIVIGGDAGLITIDDLQWADPDSLELLALIAARVTRPLTIVATWTEDDAGSNRLAELAEAVGGIEVITLENLVDDRIDELIARLAPASSLEQRRAASALAGGSPYVAEQLARELADTGAVTPEQAERRMLDRLEPMARGIAELAALATGAITLEQLCAVSGEPPARVWRTVRTLEDARVLRVVPSQHGEPVYLFYHQRLRDAADAAIDEPRRRALHHQFAESGEREGRPSEELAHHYERAGQRSRAARWALRAADTAREQLAWGVAADWYTRAIALGAEAREQLADCLFLGGKLADAAKIFEQLAGSARDRDAADQWRVRAAESYIKLGELPRGIAMIDGVLTRRGAPRARSRLGGAARTAFVAARWLAPSVRRAREIDPVLVAAYRVIASFLSTSYPIEAFEYVLRGIAAAEGAGDRDARALGMAMLAAYVAAGSLGRFGDRAIGNAQRLSKQSDAPYARMVAAGSAGILATLRGDWSAMRRAHEEGRAVCERLGLERSWEASFLGSYHAIGEYYAGEPEQALAILDRLADASDDLISRTVLGHCRGRALLLAGDVDGARACHREYADAPGIGYGMVAVYRGLLAGELALVDRDYARARAIGSELERLCRSQWLSVLPAISAMFDTMIATAELGDGAPDRARDRARLLYRRGRGSFYEVTALRLIGQAELRLGDPSATQTLARAAEIATLRGGRIDRLAIDHLRGLPTDPGTLRRTLAWSTAGMV